jgi:glutathione S-transferase
MTTSERIELLQFRWSHYNEKARWAFDWKRVPHVRRSLLPGPHGPVILWLTGKTLVPVARFGSVVVDGSAAIIDELERRVPAPPLYPADPAARAEALALQRRFDEEVGPVVRRGVFGHLLEDPAYVCHMFAGDRAWLSRRAYRALFPLTRVVMARSMGIRGAASIEAACEATRRALDLVAGRTARTGYLVGDAFTVADLAAAALLAPAVGPDHPEMSLPEPRPAALGRWLERFATHPGAEWVRETYRRHRPRESLAAAA